MSNCRVCDATTDGFACKSCVLGLERAIGDMTSLMHEVSLLATKQTRVYRASGRRLGSDEELAELEEEYGHRRRRVAAHLRSKGERITLPRTASMVNLDARELLWVAGNTLSSWARHLLEARSTDVPVGPSCPSCPHWTCTLVRARGNPVALLLALIEAVRWDEAAEAMVEEITALHGQMERAVDRAPSRVFAGPCEVKTCDQDLYAPWKPSATDEGDEADQDDRQFVCDGHRGNGVGCGAGYTWSGRRPWLAAEIGSSLVAINDLLAALPDLYPDLPIPKRHAVLGWVRDGRIVPHGHDHVGEPTFVGAELLKLIAEYRPHSFAPRRRTA